MRTFLVNWAMARTGGWRLLMRIEDLDGPRIKSEAEAATLETLRWIGLDWDGPVVRQSDDLTPYVEAMETLAAHGHVFCSRLSRRDVQHAASAPHADDGEVRFPPELRPDEGPAWSFTDRDANHRLRVDPRAIEIDDRFAGRSLHEPATEVGDFIIWTRRAAPAYQLAVVVDDMRQGVTDVVRGDDLLPSAARQRLLYERLGGTEPDWWHLPLILGPDGRRLAKRHGDTRVASYRDRGIAPERIVGLLAAWSGIQPNRAPMSASDFLAGFAVDRLPREPMTFTPEDERWIDG
jgi:glutamyl-tRNA synthetase